jgi:hypothetical protein
MQRVRVGLTGLAFIFLLVLITAAGLRPGRSVAPAGSQGETLAVLGVAPGADQGGLTRTTATPPAKPAPAATPARPGL